MLGSTLGLLASGVVAIIAFFDVRVFNPFAESNQSPCSAATFRRHEAEKRRAYEERIQEVERGSFTPLVFSSSAGMGKAATVTYKHLASLLSNVLYHTRTVGGERDAWEKFRESVIIAKLFRRDIILI